MRISLLRGAQSSAIGGAGAAARGRRTLPPSRLVALRSRSLFLSLFLLFLLGGALRSRFFSSASATAAGTTTSQTPPDRRAETRPASARERDAQDDLASPRLRRPFGAVRDAPGREMDPDAIELARFAVAEHNSKTNTALEFVRLVKVRTQLVAGILYYFTVEVREVDGGAGLYEAKVWLRQWQKFKGLASFEPVANADQGKTKI